MRFCGRRLIQFAILAACFLYNIRPKKGKLANSPETKKSPFQRRFGFQYPLTRLRKFGSLAFVKIPGLLNKTESRFAPSVFLGYSSRGTAWLFGHWSGKEKNEFVVRESGSAKFEESVMISDISMPRTIENTAGNAKDIATMKPLALEADPEPLGMSLHRGGPT